MPLDLSGVSFDEPVTSKPTKLDLSGVSFNDEEEPTSILEGGVTGFLEGLIPTTGAFAVGTRAGMAAASATPPVLPVVGPFAKPVVGGTVGLISGLLAAFGLSEGQEEVLKEVAPEAYARAQQAEKEHPYAYHAGQLASGVPYSGLGVKALKELADFELKQGVKLGMGKATAGAAGLGAGFETGMELATKEEVDPIKVAMSAAAFPVTLGNTKVGGKLAGIKEPVFTPTPEPTSEVTPEISSKTTVDSTLEQWQKEVTEELGKVEAEPPQLELPLEQSITPPEGIKPTEGIPTPQGESVEGLKPSLADSLVTSVTKGIIKEVDGTPATTDTGLPRIARRNKETGEIELNPEAAKASWEASTPDNKPWIKKTFDTPEKYTEFILKHEEEHGLSPQKEGESTLEYEKRITNQALEKVGIVREVSDTTKKQKFPSIYDVVDEADFHAKGKQVLKEQGPEVARQFADNYIRARGTDPVLVQQNVNQFISKEIQQHGTTVESASDLIERSANAILADSRKADIYSQSLVDRLPNSSIRDRMTRALEKEKGYDKLYTDKEKQELLYGTGKENAAGFIDNGYKGKLSGMKRKLKKGNIPKGHTKESYQEAINKFEYIINRLETLPSEEAAIPILKEIETRLNKIGTEAKQAGLIESLRDNYVTHILDWSKSKLSKQEQLDFMQKLQEKLAAAPKDSKIIRDFTQQRKYTFLRDLERMLKEVGGTDHGVVVHTDIAKIMNAYEKAMQTAKIQKSMIDYLKINKDVNGNPWIREDNKAAKEAKYVSFEGKGARPLQNYRVHPDLVDAMNFMFREKDPGMLVRGLGAASHLTKALNTVGSLFHAKSLLEAGGLTSPKLMLKEIFTAGSGTKAALKALKSEEDPLIDLLIREGGLKVEVEDIQRTIVPEVGQFLDNVATKFSTKLKGPNVKLVQHITDPLDKVVLQKLNAFTWDFMHAGQKVNVAKHLFTKMKLKNPEIPDAVLAREVGDYVNSTFGGLNWLQIANSVQNKFLKALAMKTMNTSSREWAQIVMFAPDWTVSTLRAFTNALPKELSKPKNWHLLDGAKGIYNPKTKGDLARRYVVTTALAWLTLLNGINMMLSNKPIWENDDPTRVAFKDGTSMQAAKHSMEAAHWLTEPDKTLGNKLGFWPKALFVGATGTAYPSPTAPKLKDTSTLGRAKAISLLGMPFQVSSAIQAPEGEGLKRAGLSTLGFPVYGVSKEKLKEAQRKGRQEAKKGKLKRMLEED